MPRRCVAANCSHTGNKLYEWPSDVNRVRKWTKFVQTKRADFPGPVKTTVLCYRHFTDCSFVNKMAYDSGFAKKLILTDVAVPTIHLQPPPQSPSPGQPVAEAVCSKFVGIQITPRAKRQRKRLVAEALSSACAMVEDTQEPPEEQPVVDDIGSDWVTDDEDKAPTVTFASKHTQTLKYNVSCGKCRQRPHRRSVRVQTDTVRSEKSPPRKRKKVAQPITEDSSDSDEESEEEEEQLVEEDPNDPTYVPEPGDAEEDDNNGGLQFDEIENDENEDFPKQRKYIVFESSLMVLFKACVICHASNKCYRYVKGTVLKVQTVCTKCGHKNEWCNQPFIRNLPVLNLLVSSAILLTGSLPSKIIRLFSFLNIQCHTKGTFFHHQALYIHEAIRRVWKTKQDALFELLGNRKEKLIVGGDARCDSMGHCAKYSSYNLMELTINKILTVQVVQSNETGGSYGMELEGLKRCRQELETNKAVVQDIITDRHRQVAKWIRENWSVAHFFDCWHIVKGLCKKLEALAKQKNMKALSGWIQSIKCHLYWCAFSSQTEEEKKKKWRACIKHIQNIHDDCSHPPITKNKEWLLPGTEVNVKAVELMSKTMFANDVGKMSNHGQTSGVEAYHSVVNHFAPKMYGFSMKGMKSRTVLAAMHYNENAGRPQKATKDGFWSFSIVYPKSKSGGHTLKKVLVDATYEYANDCFSEVVQLARIPLNERADLPPPRDDPPFLTAAVTRVDKETAVAEFRTRFPNNGLNL